MPHPRKRLKRSAASKYSADDDGSSDSQHDNPSDSDSDVEEQVDSSSDEEDLSDYEPDASEVSTHNNKRKRRRKNNNTKDKKKSRGGKKRSIDQYQSGIIKSEYCSECCSHSRYCPAGGLCIDCSTKLWSITYDKESNISTFVDQMGTERTYPGDILPNLLLVNPRVAVEWKDEVEKNVDKKRDVHVVLLQKRKKLRKYKDLQFYKQKAKENLDVMRLKVEAGECQQLTATQVFFQFQLSGEERKVKDATQFLDAGRTVVHDTAGGFKEFILTDDKPILMCTGDIPDEIVEGMDHDAKMSDPNIWGTMDVRDTDIFLKKHHGYNFEDGEHSLTLAFTPCNSTFGGWEQHKLQNENGNGFVPKSCPRYVKNPHNSEACLVFDKVHDGSGHLGNVKVTVVWMNGKRVNITDEDGAQFIVTDRGVSHPSAPLDGIDHTQLGE